MRFTNIVPNFECYLKSESSESGLHFVRSRAHEKKELAGIIRNHDQQPAILYGIDKFIPCQYEIREYEHDRSYGKQTASLHESKVKHGRNQQGIYRYTYAYDAFRGAWNNLSEYNSEKGRYHEQKHEGQSMMLGCRLLSDYDLFQISVYEIPYVEHMSKSEEAHLGKEIMA